MNVTVSSGRSLRFLIGRAGFVVDATGISPGVWIRIILDNEVFAL